MRFRWVKLNIYSLLLTLLLAAMVIVAYSCKLIQCLWIAIPFGILWICIALLTLDIYMRYTYKVKTLNRLIAQSKKRFDYRLFYPCFESPCMRSVVYFALCEIGRQQEYFSIKSKIRTIPEDKATPNMVFLKYENGITKFYEKDLQTGKISRIS